MTNDIQIPERVGFHDWYKKKKGREYPYGYTTIHNILAGRGIFGNEVSYESIKALEALFEEYEQDFPTMRTTKW